MYACNITKYNRGLVPASLTALAFAVDSLVANIIRLVVVAAGLEHPESESEYLHIVLSYR